MIAVARKLFFDAVRDAFGPMRQGQVVGLEFLLSRLEGDQSIVDQRWAAYILATTKHETAHTFEPIEEIGKGRGRKYGAPNASGLVYYGRGYVQLTWEDNYRRMGELLGLPLVQEPDLALVPEHAYQIMSVGMARGMFTGHGLERHINSDRWSYVEARRVVNGLDRAELIASYATQFELALAAGAEAMHRPHRVHDTCPTCTCQQV